MKKLSQSLISVLIFIGLFSAFIASASPQSEISFSKNELSYQIISAPNGDAMGHIALVGGEDSSLSAEGTLSIPSRVETDEGIYEVKTVTRYLNKNLRQLFIPSSVETVESFAFSENVNLESIIFEDRETEISIFGSAFSKCRNVKELEVPPLSSSSEESFAYMGIESVTFSEGFNLTEIPNMLFYQCKLLSNIGAFPESVTKIGENAFSHTAITSIKLPERLTSIEGGALNFCSKLNSISIPSGITVISEGLFTGCTALEKIILPESITEIYDGAFYACYNLSTVIFEGDKISKIGERAFGYCKKLTEFKIPPLVRQIPEEAFENCHNLRSVEFEGDNIESVGVRAFKNCYKLKKLSLSKTASVAEDAFEGSGMDTEQEKVTSAKPSDPKKDKPIAQKPNKDSPDKTEKESSEKPSESISSHEAPEKNEGYEAWATPLMIFSAILLPLGAIGGVYLIIKNNK